MQNYSKEISLKQSSNTAQSRLLALRGENVNSVINFTDSSPSYYCILSSIRRLKLNLSSQEFQPQVLPIIVGPNGSGKSALANHLRRSIPNSSSFLTGTSGLSVNNLIKHISLAAGINIQASISSEDRLNCLVEQLKINNKTITLLIDKADALSVTCLAAIVHLISYQKQQKNLSIILFGYQDLADKLSSLIGNNLECVRLKTMPILPLNNDEIKVYMGACLKSSGIKINRFKIDDNLIVKVRKLSNGLPGNIQNLLAKEIIPHLKLEENPMYTLNSKRVLSLFLLLLMFSYMHHYAFKQQGLMYDYKKFSSLIVHDLAKALV